jgi:hypothetical protein
MSKTGRWILVLLALAFLGFCGWVWWSSFHDKRIEAAWWLERHHRELSEIHRIVDAHPVLCHVLLVAPPVEDCNAPLNAKDKEAYQQIGALMRSLFVSQIDIYRDDRTSELEQIRFDMLPEGLFSPPVFGWWQPLPANAGRCRPIDLPNWYVCPGKVYWP